MAEEGVTPGKGTEMEELSRHGKCLGGDWRGKPQGVKLILEGRMQGSYQVGVGCRHYPDGSAPSESQVLVLEKAPEITAYTHPGESDPGKHWTQ